MSHIDRTQNGTDTCCANAGCGNRFDPSREGFNGECDWCASIAADHFGGAHHGWSPFECSFCLSDESADPGWALATAA